MGKIKILIMDVDGTLTDGKIYMGRNGELVKIFNIKDGCGILFILPELGIIPVIITARESDILEHRCKELNITELYQGSKNKLQTLYKVLKKYGTSLNSVAYAGDDLPDIPCMEAVKKAGGIVLCPTDAIPEIKTIADYVSGNKAGDGAIRDCINYLAQRNSTNTIKSRIQKISQLILEEDFSDKSIGEHFLVEGTKYCIQEYTTKAESECIIETHRNHIDIQYMLIGQECFKIYKTNCLTSTGRYNLNSDTEYWQNGMEASQSILVPGSLIVIYDNQPHKGAIQLGKPGYVKKVICKIAINKFVQHMSVFHQTKNTLGGKK